jgi:hypothetical protein
MEMLKNAGDLGLTNCLCLLPAGSKFYPIWFYHACVVCYSRSAVPLNCNACGRTAVIKDSEAVQYVGKNVEVRGLVVSVTASPLGTACISFGREYPDQTFAGFIAVGSKMETDQRIATLQGKIIGITGIIELHQGKPEIKVTSADQIKGLNSQLVQ